MKVKELIKILQRMNQESIVVVQKDSEGNGYSPLSRADNNAVYVPGNTWSGEVYSTEWSAEDAYMSEEDWKRLKEINDSCVVLLPTN